MPVIAIFSGLFTSGSEIAAGLAQKLDCELVGDSLLNDVLRDFGIGRADLEKTLRGETSFFNNLTHKMEKHIVFLKAALANQLNSVDLVLNSPAALMIPKNVTHVLRICIVADRNYRIKRAMEMKGVSEKTAEKLIDADDLSWGKWTHTLFHLPPWDSSLYDLKIPVQSVPMDEIGDNILKSATKAVLNPTHESLQAVKDFMLASKVNAELSIKGYSYCDVEASGGHVKVIINRNILRLEHLENELKNIVGAMEGVRTVTTHVGPKFNQPDIAMKFDFEVPITSASNVLLVDDEKEYVTTLSERLRMRDFTSDVVLNGEEALSYIETHQPKVMVLDLRMPGINGVEVLRRVKRDYPDIQVIVLTGHGTEKDKEIVLDLGAFAYLEKPVSIDELAKTLQKAGQVAEKGHK